jgi:hypothetical protein
LKIKFGEEIEYSILSLFLRVLVYPS